MPDITANKPVAGAPVESAWGGQVHDMLEGIQHGEVQIVISGAANGSLVVTFPRPYATPPTVLVTVGSGNAYSWVGAYTDNTNGTTVRLVPFHRAGTVGSATITVSWMAIGKLA